MGYDLYAIFEPTVDFQSYLSRLYNLFFDLIFNARNTPLFVFELAHFIQNVLDLYGKWIWIHTDSMKSPVDKPERM